jgi:hypothetical protein
VLIAALTLLSVSSAALIVGAGWGLVELALRNYRLAALATLIAVAALPFVLIGRNLTILATSLVAHP